MCILQGVTREEEGGRGDVATEEERGGMGPQEGVRRGPQEGERGEIEAVAGGPR